MWPIADFATLTDEILNGKLHFLCSDPSETNEYERQKDHITNIFKQTI